MEKPTRAVNIVHADHTNPPPDGHTSSSVTLSGIDYEDYLQYQANNQSSSSVDSMAHSGNSVVCLAQSSSLGPWVLDSGAFDHISETLVCFLILLMLHPYHQLLSLMVQSWCQRSRPCTPTSLITFRFCSIYSQLLV